MKFLFSLILLISLNAISQQTTTVKVPPSKDTTVVKFTTTTTTTANTQTTYTTSTIPGAVDTVVTPPVDPPPTQPGVIQGFGSQAVGGSNSADIRTVSTASQFNQALGSNRTIKFVANVTISERVNITYSYLTIDGNGYDVVVNANGSGDAISFNGSSAHHCILKNISAVNAGNDGINVIDGAHDIAIVNCLSELNRDGGIDVAGGKNVTIQNSIIGKGTAGWSGGMLITATNVSVLGCLFVTATAGGVGERGPFVHSNYTSPGAPCVDFRNNAAYNWGRSGGTGSGYSTAIGYNATGNVVNNYYYDKESASSAVANGDGYGTAASGKIYSSGNVISNGSSLLSASMANNRAEWPISSPYKVITLTACEARARIAASVGPRLSNGQAVDRAKPYISGLPSVGCN